MGTRLPARETGGDKAETQGLANLVIARTLPL